MFHACLHSKLSKTASRRLHTVLAHSNMQHSGCVVVTRVLLGRLGMWTAGLRSFRHLDPSFVALSVALPVLGRTPLFQGMTSSLVFWSVSMARWPLSVKKHTPQDDVAHDKSHHLSGGRGFANPWPSWAKPSLYELWSGLSWYPKEDEKFQGEETGHTSTDATEKEGREKHIPWSNHLTLQKPDFANLNAADNASDTVRTFWLGHAGALVELPSKQLCEPIRILFDPIFSQRCSPSQHAGPIRFVQSPVSVADLPAVHVVVISHNHYDHLDAQTVSQLWQANSRHLRFVMPLGNAEWFANLLGPDCADRVCEMDWWDEAAFSPSRRGAFIGAGDNDERALDDGTSGDAKEQCLSQHKATITVPASNGELVRLICTPAQHGSGRLGFDCGMSLWASYTLLYQRDFRESKRPFHLFFAGDTGYRLRPPTVEPRQSGHQPACPAFRQIYAKFGPADLLLLPISVGSSYSYFRSWDPVGIFPQVDGGLTAQNHLDEWEAVEVARILSGQRDLTGRDAAEVAEEQDVASNLSSVSSTEKRRPVALAIHFGTFCPLRETRANLSRLRKACQRQLWRPVRTLERRTGESHIGEEDATEGDFLVLNHGQSVNLPL